MYVYIIIYMHSNICKRNSDCCHLRTTQVARGVEGWAGGVRGDNNPLVAEGEIKASVQIDILPVIDMETLKTHLILLQ